MGTLLVGWLIMFALKWQPGLNYICTVRLCSSWYRIVGSCDILSYLLNTTHCLSINLSPQVLHICIGELGSIGSGNSLSPVRRLAITWTNADLLSIGPLGTNFREILIKIHNFSFKKMCLNMSSVKCWPFAQGEMSSGNIYIYMIWSAFFNFKSSPWHCCSLCSAVESPYNMVIFLKKIFKRHSIMARYGMYVICDYEIWQRSHAPTQWETTLYFNVISNWLGA